MIKGQLYVDLSKYIDLKKFDSLIPGICRGMATSSHLAVSGLQIYHPGTVHPKAQGLDMIPLSEAYTDFISLPDDHPLKIAGKDLTYNQRTVFLKYALNAYDHYYVYKILDETYKDKGVGEIGSHFPELVDWIQSLKDSGIFKSFWSATIMALDAGGIPWEHHDPEDPITGIFDPNAKHENQQITEFIHIKTDMDRPFYMIDPVTKERIYHNTRVAWWDERDWHGGEPINRPTFTFRVNGRYTDEFKKLTGIEGYEDEL
jgi:hypothetical protein